MAQKSGVRQIRVFLSSTFRDFTLEREAFIKDIIPELESYCRDREMVFETVDLRWGISEQAADSNDTIRICLEEIERCEKLGTAPYLFILLGNRYGWQPLPDSIESHEYRQIREKLLSDPLRASNAGLMDKFYREDLNCLPPHFVLHKEMSESSPVVDADDEELLLGLLRDAVSDLGFSPEAREKYSLSATGYEIMRGVFEAAKTENIKQKIICFFRDIEGVYDHIDYDRHAKELLDSLKERLADYVDVYRYHFETPGISCGEDMLAGFRQKAIASLKKAVDENLAASEGIFSDPLALEIYLHRRAMEEAAAACAGREELTGRALQYLQNMRSGSALLLHGTRGVGKSFVTARVAWEAEKLLPGAVVVCRLVGVSPASSDPSLLLKSIIGEISQAYGKAVPGAEISYPEICAKFEAALRLASPGKPLVVVVDAVDQLAAFSGDDPLMWLPAKLPENAALVVSAHDGASTDAIMGKIPNAFRLPVTALNRETAAALLPSWLAGRGRALTKEQTSSILSAFAENGLPLYLRIAFELSSKWRSFEAHTAPRGMEGIISGYLSSLSREENHGALLVRNVLGFCFCARYGVSETELLALLSRDEETMADFRRRSPNSPPVDSLPFMVWARLNADIAFMLKDITQNGIALFQFYHMQIRDVVEAMFSDDDKKVFHAKMAKYFDSLPLYIDSGQKRPNIRKLGELSFHIMQGGAAAEMEKLLADQSYLTAKIAAGMAADLVSELWWLISQSGGTPEDERRRRSIVESFMDFVIEKNLSGGNFALDLQMLNSLAITRPETTLHEMLFNRGADMESLTSIHKHTAKAKLESISNTCLLFNANRSRRIAKLGEAEGPILQVWENIKRKRDSGVDKSMLLYELGYIRYMQGRFSEACELMTKSADYAGRKNNPVSERISLIVGSQIRTVAALGTANAARELRRNLEFHLEAAPLFRQYSAQNSLARRFVVNNNEHCVWTASLMEDPALTEKFYLDYANDPFTIANLAEEEIAFRRAKVEMLKGETEAACRDFEIHAAFKLAQAKSKGIRQEFYAEIYYFWGKTLLAGGDRKKAGEIFGRGLALGDEPGNHKWKELIRAAM